MKLCRITKHVNFPPMPHPVPVEGAWEEKLYGATQ